MRPEHLRCQPRRSFTTVTTQVKNAHAIGRSTQERSVPSEHATLLTTVNHAQNHRNKSKALQARNLRPSPLRRHIHCNLVSGARARTANSLVGRAGTHMLHEQNRTEQNGTERNGTGRSRTPPRHEGRRFCFRQVDGIQERIHDARHDYLSASRLSHAVHDQVSWDGSCLRVHHHFVVVKLMAHLKESRRVGERAPFKSSKARGPLRHETSHASRHAGSPLALELVRCSNTRAGYPGSPPEHYRAPREETGGRGQDPRTRNFRSVGSPTESNLAERGAVAIATYSWLPVLRSHARLQAYHRTPLEDSP